MSLQIFRDGRPDRRIEDHRLLKNAQRQDDYTNALKQELERQAGMGTYGFMGHVGRGGEVTAPRDALGEGISRAERIARVRERMARGEAPQALFFDEASGTEILAVEDAEAYEEGWICHECLQYQAIVSNECNWRIVGAHRPPVTGCGYRRDIF